MHASVITGVLVALVVIVAIQQHQIHTIRDDLSKSLRAIYDIFKEMGVGK